MFLLFIINIIIILHRELQFFYVKEWTRAKDIWKVLFMYSFIFCSFALAYLLLINIIFLHKRHENFIFLCLKNGQEPRTFGKFIYVYSFVSVLCTCNECTRAMHNGKDYLCVFFCFLFCCICNIITKIIKM